MMKDKKVLLVSHEMSYTGAPRSLLQMAGILREIGYDITVWTLQEGNFEQEFEKDGIAVEIVSFPDIVLDKRILILRQFELIIASTIFCASFATYAKQYAKTILYIMEAQNIPDLIEACGLNVADLIKADYVLCVSEYAKRFIEETYQIDNIRVIHNFVDDSFDMIQKKKREEKKTFDFLISGTVEPRKGQKEAIEAFLLLPKEMRKLARLHLVGAMPEWAKSYQEKLQIDTAKGVIYHGEITGRDELLQLYNSMDVVIVASMDEACSLVALEAAMLGKAMILTDCVGAKYLVDSSCLVKAGDCVALSWKMRSLIGDLEKVKSLGERNRRRYLEAGTRIEYKKNILILLEELEAGKGKCKKSKSGWDRLMGKRRKKIYHKNGNKKVSIALICDDNYVMPTSVTIQSIISNAASGYMYQVFVIVIDICDDNKKIFEMLDQERENVTINIVSIGHEFIEKLYNENTEYDTSYMVATTSALAKFKLATLIPEVSKILYLDSDLIVKTDLIDLFNTDISNFYIAAVRDLPQVVFENQLVTMSGNYADYFNSGVMLLNLKQIRENDIENELVKMKKCFTKDTLMDQNVFNTVMKGHIHQLHIKYNVCYTNLARSRGEYKYSSINALYGTAYSSLKDIYMDASIIHFSSKMKPWHIWDTYIADEWLFYYNQLPQNSNKLVRMTRADRISIEKETIAEEIKYLEAELIRKSQFKIIPIVFATNNNYAPYASVAIESVIENASEEYYYDIYVLHNEELLKSQRCRLEDIRGKNYSVSCIDVRKGINELNLYSRAHYSKQMYYRLLIPEILTYYEKVIYLDCDLVTLRDVSELFNTDIEDNIIGAVSNFVTYDFDDYLKSKKFKAMEYVNSGVLIINTKRFINEKVKEKCIKYIQANEDLLCPDQDAINAVCSNNIYYLDDQWNVQRQHFEENKFGQGAKLMPEYRERFLLCADNPYILHFTSGRKPWKNPLLFDAHIFWKYAKKTDFYEEILFGNLNLSLEDKIGCIEKRMKPCNENDTFSNYLLSEMTIKEKRMEEISKELDFFKYSLSETKSSVTYKIGRIITFFPRLIRHIVMKYPM